MKYFKGCQGLGLERGYRKNKDGVS